MAITIKQQGEQWKLILCEEELVFPDRKTLWAELDKLLILKDKYKKWKELKL